MSRQQELHSELLEEHDRLRRQGTAMRSQLDEAAAQLLHLKAQFEKGKRGEQKAWLHVKIRRVLLTFPFFLS